MEAKIEKITCVCGSEIKKNGLKKHEQSKKHQRFLEDQARYGAMQSAINQQLGEGSADKMMEFLARFGRQPPAGFEMQLELPDKIL